MLTNSLSPNGTSSFETLLRSTRKPPSRMGTLAAELVKSCHRVLQEILDPYRPELHYMRGPGPKWRAKHRPDGRS
jgi:hypothetical protein